MLVESVFPLRIVSFPIYFVSFPIEKGGFPSGSVTNSSFPSAECQVFPKSAWMSGKAESLLRDILEAPEDSVELVVNIPLLIGFQP